MHKHLNITVHGRVQGVGYRAFVHRTAREIGLTGIVKNQQDGTVYIEAEGDSEKLNALMNACKEGPFLAQVSRLDAREGDYKGFKDFRVEY